MRRTAALAAAVLLAAPALAQAAWPGLNGRIAFQRAGEVWVTDAGGGDEDPLTTEGGQEPSWSPDGTRIAFVADRDASGLDIWVMNADGSGQSRLTTGQANEHDPVWSPDGTRVAFSGFSDSEPQIMAMNANGSGIVKVSNTANINRSPAWSPDGTRIAWRDFSRSGVSISNADGSDPRGLAVGADEPNWAPDGSRLLVDLQDDIWSLAPDGSDPRRITTDPAGDTSPASSPDGRYVAFTSGRGGGLDIWIKDLLFGTEIQETLNALSVADEQADWQALGPPPDVTALSRPVAGSPGATLTVDGTGFVLRSVARWNGADRPTTYVSPTRLSAQLTAADVASTGTAQVTVFTAPAGGGLSLPRTATIDPAPPPPPAPALTLSRATITATWARSRVRGSLLLAGAAARAGRVEVQVLRGAGARTTVLQRRRLTLAAGPFTHRVALSPTLPPGALRVRLREVGAVSGPRLTDAVRRVVLRPPPEGVARADVSALQGGPATRSLRRPARAFARFAFAARPAARRTITVAWTRDGRPAGGAVRKPRAARVVAFIGAPGGLPPGLYRCTLRAGRTVVAVATLRVT